VKNRRGNSARGRKITGMQFLPRDPSRLLITSNDSRIRLYDGAPRPRALLTHDHLAGPLPSGLERSAQTCLVCPHAPACFQPLTISGTSLSGAHCRELSNAAHKVAPV
jgi:hypothetical protein